MFIFLIPFFAFVLAIVVFALLWRKAKEKGFFSRSMNLSLFLVTLPQQIGDKEKEPALDQYLRQVEQFFSSLSGIKEGNKFKKILLGNPSFVFEIAVHRTGEQIHFYVACPRHLSQMIEKQILGFWPKANVQPANDYNIFNPSGNSAGAVFALVKSPIFPLRQSQEFGADPLSSITSVLTKLAKEGEGAAVQIVIRPSRRSLKKMAEKTIGFMQKGQSAEEALKNVYNDAGVMKFAQSGQKDERSNIQKPPPQITPLQQTQISAISQKVSQPLFDVNLRILASSQTESRTSEILGQLQSAFDQFSQPVLNQVKFKRHSGGKLKKLFYNFAFRIFSESESRLLSSGELASLFHFPASGQISTPNIKWLKSKQAPAPPNLAPEGLIIGKNVFRGEEKVVCIQEDDRRRHFYIIGQTGTGKSALMQELIRQDIEAGRGVALIDPHGELAEDVLGLVPANRVEDVIYFNPGDIDRPLGLNMLEYDPRFPEAKTFVVNELLEIFEKLYNLKSQGFGGPMFEQYMRNSLLLVMDDPESGNSLIEVPKVLADVNFRKYKLSRCKNIVVKNFWEQEAEKAGGEAALANMVPYITSKMNVFIANDLVRPIISQQQSSFNFRDIMDQGKILIVNLSKGKVGDINSFLLGMIIVGKILLSAFSRADLPSEQRRDFYLYIDEFQNVTTKTIASILAEARKYRLNMIFGHQFIGQLDEDTRKAIFGNVGSFLAFRVGPEDAKYLLSEFEPVFDENDLVNIDNYNAVLKLLISGATSRSFNIATFAPKKGDGEIRKLVKEYSRVRYGRDRAQVEAELYERLQKSGSGI